MAMSVPTQAIDVIDIDGTGESGCIMFRVYEGWSHRHTDLVIKHREDETRITTNLLEKIIVKYSEKFGLGFCMMVAEDKDNLNGFVSITQPFVALWWWSRYWMNLELSPFSFARLLGKSYFCCERFVTVFCVLIMHFEISVYYQLLLICVDTILYWVKWSLASCNAHCSSWLL